TGRGSSVCIGLGCGSRAEAALAAGDDGTDTIWRRCARHAECRHGLGHRIRDHGLPLGRGHVQLLVAVYDGARLEEHGRQARHPTPERLWGAAHARLGIPQLALARAHERLGVMRRVGEPVLLEPEAEKPAELQARPPLTILVADEDGMSLEAIAEMARLP